VVDAVVDQLEGVIDSWGAVRLAQGLLDDELLIVSLDQLLVAVGNFDLIAELEYLDFGVAVFQEVFLMVLVVEDAKELIVCLDWQALTVYLVFEAKNFE